MTSRTRLPEARLMLMAAALILIAACAEPGQEASAAVESSRHMIGDTVWVANTVPSARPAPSLDRLRQLRDEAFWLTKDGSPPALRRALDLYHTIAAGWKARGNATANAVALLSVGSIYTELSEADSASKYIGKSLEVFRKEGHHHNEGVALFRKAQLMVTLEQPDSALMMLDDALPLLLINGPGVMSDRVMRMADSLRAVRPGPGP